MTATQQWLRDMVAGGWNPKPLYYNVSYDNGRIRCSGDDHDIEYYTLEKLLLDPKAWKAVGKKRGWKEEFFYQNVNVFGEGEEYWFGSDCGNELPQWRAKMHTAIDYIQDGLSIEESLQAIS